MNTADRGTALDSRRRWRAACALGALAGAAFIVYGSFVPFNFQAPADGVVQAGLAPMASVRPSRTDFVSNVLLFMPFPFFLMGALSSSRSTPARTAVLAAGVPAATATLAWIVEWGQQFLPSRTGSWYDVIAATLAAAIVVPLWMTVGRGLAQWAERVMSERQPRTGLEAALVVYAVVIALIEWLPLDITIRPAELAEKYRAGRIVLAPLASLVPFDLEAVRRTAGDVLTTIPFGVFGLIAWSPAGQRRPWAQAFLAGFAIVAGIEAAQLFVFSRTFDVTDVLTGGVGVAIGVWAGASVWADRRATSGRRVAGIAGFALVVWLLVLIAQHWYPFDFTLNGEAIRSRLAGLVRVPFSAYYAANPFNALADAMSKVLLAVPLGGILGLLWPAVPRSRLSSIRVIVLMAAAGAVFGGIEAGQLLLPGRYPDVTDVIIGAVGAGMGLGVVSRFQRASRVT